MEPLQPPDSHFLRAALGWIELGNWDEANDELEKISPEFASHPHLLRLRYEIYAHGGKWEVAAEAARALTEAQPDESQFWIFYAYATRRMNGGGIPKAREILTRAQTLFPKEPLICYNLACYECQLNNQEEARRWLTSAFGLGDAAQLKLMAQLDPDLKPLWGGLNATV